MNRRMGFTAATVVALLFNTVTFGLTAAIGPGTLTDLGPSASSQSSASDVNSLGLVVGMAQTDSGTFHAFAYDTALVDLGTLGGASSSALAVNSAGQVAGFADIPVVGSHAVMWDSAGIHDLGTLGGLFSAAYAINDSGAIAGDSLKADGTNHSFLYQNGAMNDLGTLGGPNSYTAAMNANGQVAGTAETPSRNGHAFLFDGVSMVDLGTLGGASSNANAINRGGSVVGCSDTTSGETHAFRSDGGQMYDLGTLGGFYSSASAINDSGQTVGMSMTATSEFHAFLHDGVSMVDLGTLGGSYSNARSINRNGQIVGISMTASGEFHACLWDSSGIHDLGTLGGAYGDAVRVNDGGEVVGVAYNSGQVQHAFRLGDYAPPAPSDSTPPVTTASSVPTGWVKSPVTVSLTATDSGSGVASIAYWATGAGTFQTVNASGNSASVTIQASGETTLWFSATDNAGNAEQAQSVTVRIDPDAPSVSASAKVMGFVQKHPHFVTVAVSGNVSDALSGIAAGSAKFSVIDEYGQVQPSGNVTLDSNGNYSFTLELDAKHQPHDKNGRRYRINIQAADNAGNQGSASVDINLPHHPGCGHSGNGK